MKVKLVELRSDYFAKLAQSNQVLSTKNKENELLLSEVHHRVKNNLAIVSSIFDWKIRSASNPEYVSDLKEMKSRVRAIATLHETLYQGGLYGSVDLGRYLRGIALEARAMIQNKAQSIDIQILVPASISVPIQQALPLGLIAHEFIANSIKHGFINRETGTIKIGWKVQSQLCEFSLSDDGIGCMAIGKGSGTSLGLKLIQLLGGQLDSLPEWDGSKGVSLKLKLKPNGDP